MNDRPHNTHTYNYYDDKAVAHAHNWSAIVRTRGGGGGAQCDIPEGI